jgi:site-specific DNA recombinase
MTETNETRRAVLYLRVSTKEQAQRDGDPEGYSIPAQREACKRKAASLGAAVVDEFADRGESARKADRPQLQALLAYIRETPIDYVIVHKIDRLARNRADDVEITLAIKAAGAALISCSENIDETPSGLLLHGIMSSIAEFYSRNLANEVIKGSVQKAKSGGTIGKAPLGYRNIRRIHNGREVRTVEIDPVRGPLMNWAFETYATGAWSVRRLCTELNKRGLTTVPGPVRPEKPIYQSLLHMRLRDPYYKGLVRYRGVEYQGAHEPLVTPEVWERVQDVLSAQNHAGTKQRERNHYLKGTVFCGDCGSRLLITYSRGRAGKVYPYYVCSGRHNKFTSCTFRAVLIEAVESKVEDVHAEYRLKPELGEAIERTLILEFETVRREAADERQRLLKRQKRLLAERDKLLQAHYAEAIPLDLLKSEQDRIRDSLSQISDRLSRTEFEYNACETNLVAALKFLEDNYATYLEADTTLRRQINQALFKRIYIERSGNVRADLTEPFSSLLSPTVRDLVATRTQSDHLLDWKAWEDSFNDNTHERDPVGVGLSYESLVGGTGLEPVTPSLSSWCSPN